MIKKFVLTAAVALTATTAHADAGGSIGDVFVIAMENQNSAVNGANASGLNPIYGNSAAPYINSLITPGNANAQFTSYASAYHDIVYNSTTDLHPSEPNYVWQISGRATQLNDNPPTNPANVFPAGTANLGTSLTSAGLTWKSYQEDIDTTGGNSTSAVATNTVALQSQWTVPVNNFSGTNAGGYTNAYNGSDQFNYAAKHNPFVFFPQDQTASNYAPLQQLTTDLANNTVANFNWITPDQYNDMHTALSGGFTYDGVHYTGNQANIAQGDNFLSIVVPEIEASQAWKNNGLIVIWTDEDEGDTPGTNGAYSNMEILIGHDTKGNAFTDFVPMNHNTDLESYLQLYGLNQSGYPSNITGSNNLSSLLKPGAILPEPGTWAMMILGLGAVGATMRQRQRALAV